MKPIFVLPFLLLALATTSIAQQFEVPRPSPTAKVTQTVGLTDITVEYSSPGVHGRQIWGGLLPWGELWRAGANSATKVTFSRDVAVGSTPVPAGTYSLFVIPQQKSPWTVILNKDSAQSGTGSYKKELDLLRLDVKPDEIPLRERLAYLVADFTSSNASLDLEWERVRLSIPIKLDTDNQLLTNLKTIEDGTWAPYNQMASYQLSQKKDYDAGLTYVEKSLKIRETWQNVWTKAQLLAAKGKYKDAVGNLEKAQKLGEKAPPFFVEESKKQMADWRKKI